MSRASVVQAVAQRWVKQASRYWSDADPRDLDEFKSVLRDDLKLLVRLTKTGAWWSATFRNLAEPLIAPKLNFFADWSDRFLSDLKELYSQLEAAIPLADRAQKEWEELAGKWASEEDWPSHGLIETIQDLPSVASLYRLVEKLEPLQQRLDIRAEDPPVDWFLEEYVGGESGIYKKLQRLTPPTSTFSEEMLGIMCITGFLQTLTSEEVFQDLVVDLRPE